MDESTSHKRSVPPKKTGALAKRTGERKKQVDTRVGAARRAAQSDEYKKHRSTYNPKNIQEEDVYRLASQGCTMEESAAILGCSLSTIDRNFSEAHRAGRNNMLHALRAKQIELALKGNVTMLIFLGKAYLGQYDYQRIESKVETTQKLESVDELRGRLAGLIRDRVKSYNGVA
jgi:hypothetical protein